MFLSFFEARGRGQQALPIDLQGRMAVDGVAFTGTGKFKFALVTGTGASVLWTHDGTSSGFAFEPTGSVDLNVSRGLYSVLLGDTTVFGMTQTINPAIFSNPDVRLRIWFNDGVHGFQKLNPDQRLSAVGYSFTSQKAQEAAVLTGNVTASQIPTAFVTNNAVNINLTGSFTGDGSGLVGLRGSTPFQLVSNVTVTAFPNTGYLVTNVLDTAVTMPLTATMRIGDIIRIAGPAGSWKAVLQANQQIKGADVLSGLGAVWTPRAGVVRWSSVASSANGNRLIAGTITSGHLQFSRDGGVTWTNSTSAVDPIRAWAAVASAADGMQLLAAASASVLYLSKDGGDTWTSVGPSARNWKTIAVSGDGTNMLAVATASTLSVSTNGGDNWKEHTEPALGTRNWTSLATSYDGSRMYACGDGFFTSTSRGTSWTASAAPFTSIACSADGLRLAAALSGQIVTSTDGGTNWVTRASAGQRTWGQIVVSADGVRIVAASTTGTIASMNGGTTWTAIGLPLATTGLAFNADGTKLVASVDGGSILISEMLRTKTSSVGGFLIGDDYSSVELQHIGNGTFMVLTSSGNLFAY